MADLCTYLGWDSDFFGRRIARLNPTRLSRDQADHALVWCEANRIDCLYFLAESDDAETVLAAEAHQFAEVDIRLTLEWRGTRSTGSSDLRPSRPDEIESIKAMARKNHGDTRFYYDGHFPPQRCDDLYGAWIERDDRENTLLVAERDGQPVGYITCALHGTVGQIGLLGVGAAWQGQGIGPLLVRGALDWFTDHGVEHVQVVTQGRNTRAQRTYQRCGFITAQVQLWYHRWFDRKEQQGAYIPFNKPLILGNELAYIAASVQSGKISGDATYTKKIHALLESEVGVPCALLTPSCTHALEMSALLLNLQAGDEVITPSFTFVSTVNAFVLRGAKPIFADIRSDTLNIDENKLEALITPRTKAIFVVHYAGVGCEMDAILQIASRHGLPVVEDNAQGLFGRYKGKPLGTFGVMATQSFHETKSFTCGQGGALLINDTSLIDRAEIVRDKGTNRSSFFRGMVDKYTWVDLGSSYVLSDVLAACLYAQLEARDEVQRRRAKIFNTYNEALQNWSREHNVCLPTIPDHCEQSYHMFYMLLPSLEIRTALTDHLKANGIMAVFHYLPLHLSDMGQKFGGKLGDCPVTEDITDRLLRLPFYNDMTEEAQARVISALYGFEDW